MCDIHIVRHRMYYDGFEDYRCKVNYQLGHPGRLADHSDLSFVFFDNTWVLVRERDWCTSDDIPGIVERLNHVTGLNANTVVYAFHEDKDVVMRAEQFACGGDPYRYPLIDLLTYPPVMN
jgi:hypothetical protein